MLSIIFIPATVISCTIDLNNPEKKLDLILNHDTVAQSGLVQHGLVWSSLVWSGLA